MNDTERSTLIAVLQELAATMRDKAHSVREAGGNPAAYYAAARVLGGSVRMIRRIPAV